MIISLVKTNPCINIDTGLKLKAEGYSVNGGVIIHPNQLRLANVPIGAIGVMPLASVRRSDGKVFKGYCSLRREAVIIYR